MKKTVLAMMAIAGACTAATAQTALTQNGYALTVEYTVPGITSSTNSRSGVGIHDKFFVNYHAEGIRVYNQAGELQATIPPTAGYHNWVNCNVDAAGNLIAQLDVKTFDGSPSANGKHGFMVIDTETNEVLADYWPMDGGFPQRYDAMSPVAQNIMTDYNTRVFAVLSGVANTYQESYNQMVDGVVQPGYWKVAGFATNAGIDQFPAGANVQTSTGYVMEYPNLNNVLELAVYSNVYYLETFSAEGKYGNGIRRYTNPGNYQPTTDYFYTPMHSGLTAYNIFNLGGKQYIVYPAKNPSVAAGQDNRPGDAFAIAEVSYVASPLTDMTMEGETLVDGKPVGNLVAIFPGVGDVAGLTACTPSYTIEPVEDDENSVYIYVFSSGVSGYKWKFTVNAEGGGGEDPEPEPEPAPDPEPAQSILTQDDVHLTQVFSAPLEVTTGSRSGVAINDNIYAAVFSASGTKGAVNVYSSTGDLVKTIEAPAGYNIWTAAAVDAAGHVLVQFDKNNFADAGGQTTGWDGTDLANPGHGFMIIDSKTNDVLQDIVPMGGGYTYRCDAMAPVAQNIMTDYNTRVMQVLNGNVNSYQQSYNQVAGELAAYWKVAAFNTAAPLTAFQAITDGAVAATAQTANGTALEYKNAEGALELAVYSNYTYNSTYSAKNFYGNPIMKYTGAGNYQPTYQYFYTPMHGNLPGFNIFTLAGKQYIIYPANSIAKRASRLGDAFVITEVTMVDTPLTNIEAAGEKFVGDGTLNPDSPVMAYYAGTGGNVANSNVASYTIEPIPGQDNSVYIYVYCSGAPVNKWRFTVGQEGTVGVTSVESDENAPVEYFNLQGVRVAEPQNGIFIRRQGNKVTKVIL